MFVVTQIFNSVWKNQDGGQSLWLKCIFLVLVFYCWYLVWQPAGFHIVFNRLLSAGGSATICAAWPLFLTPRRFLVSLSARQVKANECLSLSSGRIVGSGVLHLWRSQFCRTEQWWIICHHSCISDSYQLDHLLKGFNEEDLDCRSLKVSLSDRIEVNILTHRRRVNRPLSVRLFTFAAV